MNTRFWRFVGSVALAAVLCGTRGQAATAPSLGTAQSFAVLGGSTVTNTGPTLINGNLGLSPGTSVTGFPPGVVTGGTIHAGDGAAGTAQTDASAAFTALNQPCDV